MTKEQLQFMYNHEIDGFYLKRDVWIGRQKKGTHFNSNGFLKGLATAKASSSNYTKSADKWLKDNQKKYGYTYTNKPTK